MRYLAILALMAFLVVPLVGCKKEAPPPVTPEKVEEGAGEAVEGAGEAIEGAGEAVEEGAGAVKDAAKAVEEKATE